MNKIKMNYILLNPQSIKRAKQQLTPGEYKLWAALLNKYNK